MSVEATLEEIVRRVVREELDRYRDGLEARPTGISPAEVARLLSVSTETVNRLIVEGRIPLVDLGVAKRIVPRAWVDQVVADAAPLPVEVAA